MQQTDVQPPPSRAEPPKAPSCGTVWSQFSSIQGGQSSQRTPGDTTTAPRIALASLPPSDRDAVNGKLARLVEALDRARRSEPHNNRLLPWSRDIGQRQFSPTPHVDASAKRGGWSAEAVAFAAYLDAWSALNNKDATAIAQMENAVGLGSLLAARHLGDIYLQGYREQAADPVHAARWYQAAAAQGDPDAAARLAVMYHDGRGLARDAALARRFLVQAIIGNSALVRQTVSGAARGRSQDVRLLAAFGIKRDEIPISSFDLWNERQRLGLVRTALDLLDRAASGDRMAMNRLAAMIADKEVFEEDQRVMARLALESGKRGHPHSAATYGFILSKGPAGLAKPGEAPLWMFAAWALDPKSSDIKELFRLSLEQLPAEQRTGEQDFFKAASAGLGLTVDADRAQRPTPQ
jgi:TPR repeat protein